MLISPTTGLPLASLGVEKRNPNPDFLGITNTFTYKTLVYTFCEHSLKVVTNIQEI
jgi:hypothetical protein